jgi:hypothetical protein
MIKFIDANVMQIDDDENNYGYWLSTDAQMYVAYSDN